MMKFDEEFDCVHVNLTICRLQSKLYSANIIDAFAPYVVHESNWYH